MDQDNADVILIEDSLDDAGLIVRALKNADSQIKILHIGDGVAARQLFSSGLPGRPRLIVLDLNMPGLSGLELLQEIKQNQSLRHIPVVILTSSDDGSDIEECYRNGVNGYVVKPVSFENFNAAVRDLGSYWTRRNESPLSGNKSGKEL